MILTCGLEPVPLLEPISKNVMENTLVRTWYDALLDSDGILHISYRVNRQALPSCTMM